MMVFRFLYLTTFYLFSMSLPACFHAHGETLPAEETYQAALPKPAPVAVKVQLAERRAFPLRTLTTGTLVAAQQAEIRFPKGGALLQLPIQEGQLVKKGDLLAEVDDASLQLQLQQSRIALEEAVVNKKDLLIANGGDPDSDSSVSDQKLDLIMTLSGVKRAEHNIKQTEYDISQTRVLAPFDGIVAEIKTKTFEQVSSGQVICTLIDPQSFEVAFAVLEQEAVQLEKGQAVGITPVAQPDRRYTAYIRTINPQVSDQGLVQVRAALRDVPPGRLLQGMNTQVAIEKNIPGQLIVPKDAIVLRAGREVVFTYHEPTQTAEWHYVESIYRNDEQVAISGDLKAGSLVIYAGQLNLDHQTAVVVEQ